MKSGHAAMFDIFRFGHCCWEYLYRVKYLTPDFNTVSFNKAGKKKFYTFIFMRKKRLMMQ